MATVMHGRRKGQTRSAPTLPPLTNGTMLPNGTDLREVTVLSKADWERIQMQLNRRAMEEERIRKNREEKERLQELSKERVKHWSNTVKGQRQKKLEARKLREAKEEEERKQMDIEEAKYQAAKRKEAIERAKTQQYYQTDRVKGFHGALLLTEVLKEREAQLELKRLKEQASDGKDRDLLELAQREYEQEILRDQEEAARKIKATRENANFQKAQINEHLKSYQREKDEEQAEGAELKRLAAQYELEKKRLEEIRAAEAHNLMEDNLKQIDDVKRMKQVHKQQDEEEDEECRIFSQAKRKMMRLRAEKEKELHNEKQSKLEAIRQKLHAQIQQKIDDEDDRIKRAEQESEERRAREEAAKEAKNRKMQAEITEHRYQQMRERERKQAEDRVKQIEMLRVKKEADQVFAANEQEKQRRRLGEAKELQSFHLNQLDDIRQNELRQKEEQLEYDRKNMELLNIEEQQFQEYANKVIDHCAKGGRNVYPLRKAAKEGAGGGLGPVFPGRGGVRPSYMVSDQSGVQLPNYQRDSTNETKDSIYGQEKTNKRLGFVW